MKNLFCKSARVGLALMLTSIGVWAQAPYHASSTKINALVHTKLDVKFDYSKRHLIGKEWVTLKPYAYPTDSLTLDAQGMDIRTIALVNGKNLQTLKYTYDEEQLKIQLGKKFLPGEAYTIFIDYTAKPDELKVKGSAAITDAKGLYFINPDSAVKGKPVQIWTQGETEASSAWFPTIDKPNQKTTAEISITAPTKYVTLSNGKLVSQLKNANGTRTDTWKMDLPHSPYLFMMAVGDFKIYRDKWNNKEVNYYLEPAYAPYAKQIFGLTPEMIDFYSKTLGVDYPWNKYSQIVVRDYVSGAMENTTATLHGAYVQRTPREMLDENFGQAESTIAHELFHQWFGDYVTAESWSNLTVNESFANYSEYLWAEHKYGKDAADAHNYEDMSQYLGSKKEALKNLVRFHYADKEEVFDAVSYQKGGRILNMMRNYLGDKVFFKGLNIYLKQNAFKNGEAHQLRLAMEEASGQDMNWFFNQWYFNARSSENKYRLCMG
ncbi:M1 family metallopeptidase [Pedobacter panaciterrae]